MDALMQAQHKASEALYKNQAESQGGSGPVGGVGGRRRGQRDSAKA